MNILLHACCAPCLIETYKSLVKEGHEVKVLFYNPNIMPYREFRKRLESFKEYTHRQGISSIIDEDYKLEYMLRRYLERGESPRCRVCYYVRLGETARIASERNFDAFSTTLAVSPYQDHELIRKAGEAAAREHQVEFVYKDWRPLFRATEEAARMKNLYMQTYCGCIFSEEERYRPSVRKKIARERRKAREKEKIRR